MPTVNNLTPLDGYVIEFKYWRKRVPTTVANQPLQIPDDYFDILVAGVNFYGYQYLQKPMEAKTWNDIFRNGIREMIRDKNQFNNDFMKPDMTTQAFPAAVIPGFLTGS